MIAAIALLIGAVLGVASATILFRWLYPDIEPYLPRYKRQHHIFKEDDYD